MKTKYTLLLVVYLLIVTNLFGQDVSNEVLILVHAEEKSGYINFDGTVVIPVEFDDIRRFSEDKIAVNKGAIEYNFEKNGGKWGYWNRAGQEIIPLQYQDAKEFSEGLAPVKLNGKYGFVNTNNQITIDFQFDDANPFQEGLAAVKLEDKWGFIDKKGGWVIKPTFHRVGDFDTGFAVIFHLVDKYEYRDGQKTFYEEEGKYGLIDKTGAFQLDTIYDSIGKFENGFASIALNRKKGFVDSTGTISIPIKYDKVEGFSEGLAVVAQYMIRPSYHDFGYTKHQTDSLEKEVAKLMEENANDFNIVWNHPTYHALTRATAQKPKEELMHGYINEQGAVVIDFKYDEADPFRNGLAKVRLGKSPMLSMVYTDKDGNQLPSYQEEIGIGANLIDKKGNLLLDKNQDQLFRAPDGYLSTINAQGAGLSRENLEEIYPNQFANLGYLGNGYFFAAPRNTTKKLLLKDGAKIELDEKIYRCDAAIEDRILVKYLVEKTDYNLKTKYGIINEKGAWILNPTYDSASIEFGKRRR